MQVYDFVIIGGGLGGLQCAYILASEGYCVIVLEKNNQLGGNLQVFSRSKKIFDTGVHYIGSLDEGQNLNVLFNYFGIMNKLKLKKMDESGFDKIIFHNDPIHYPYAQGYEKFIKILSEYFPEERNAIEKYCKCIKDTCTNFPLYNLTHEGKSYLDTDYLTINAHDFIASLTGNEKLRNVLAGNNMLYAGIREKSPFYVHALVVNSYIESSYRCIDGGSQIAKHLVSGIRKFGGKVLKRANVISAVYKDCGEIESVQLEGGDIISGSNYISNVHPAITVNIFGEAHFRKAYVNRINNLDNSISSFTLHLILEENSFPFLNHNIYYHKDTDVWSEMNYTEENWPLGIMISTPANSKNPEFSDVMSIMAYMKFSDVEKWSDTFNTVTKPGTRNMEYELFKKEKEDSIIREVETCFPGISNKIKERHSSTPLTFRDYIGNPDGSMYGIIKDCNNPLKSLINPKTKIPNLYLTGANLNLHGILGVSVSSLVTCFEFIDKNYLLDKIKNAK